MRWKPDSPHPPRRILLIQLRRIGDAVLLTPTLDALGETWPEARLHLLTDPPIPDLFRGDGRLHVLWLRPHRLRLPRLLAALRREAFDLVLDAQSLPVTALLSRSTGAFAVGFRRRGRGHLYHRAVNLAAHAGTDFAADHKLDLLRALGLSPRLSRPRLVPPPPGPDAWPPLPAGPRVVLAPVSRRPAKQWTVEAFAATARALHEHTQAVFAVAGGPGEEASLHALASRLTGIPHAVRTCGNLVELGELLVSAHLFLGNDGGPRHMAIAFGVPTLAYFGPQNPSHWTPPGAGPHRVIWNPGRNEAASIRSDLIVVPGDPPAVARAAAEMLERGGTR